MNLEKNIQNQYVPVIGLEVHAQLLTESKIFASDQASFGDSPNTNISVITLGHPGTLPKFNRQALSLAVKMGLACNSEITRENIFDRKNYFYPDLPKGYQLTQDKTPICVGGYVTVKRADGQLRELELHKIHLEEDAGKSIHMEGEEDSMLDYNRAGVPLVEIVTHPVIQSAEEAGLFLAEVRKIVRYLEICDGNMEEGSLRCDANISVMPAGSSTLGQKVEIKNMNSIRNVQRAIDHEIIRQIKALEAGESIVSETRTFNADDGTTSSMRSKETLNDYRYFPDPDLSPVVVSEEWLASIKASMPTLPEAQKQKLISVYNLPEYDAIFLSESKELAAYFEATCLHCKNYKSVSNWMMGPIKSTLNEKGWKIEDFNMSPSTLSALIALVEKATISHTAAAQKVFPMLVAQPDTSPLEIAKRLNLLQQSNEDAIQPIIDEVIAQFPDKVKAYRHGKKGLIGMFMGEVMKKGKNQFDPKRTNELLRKTLG